MTEVIRKSDFARELGVDRSRVSQMIKQGLPVRADGRLDAAVARRWVRENIHSQRGGWTPGMRKKSKKMRSTASTRTENQDLTAADPETPVQMAVAMESEFFDALPEFAQGAVAMTNFLCHPRREIVLAEMAVDFGCTAAHAFGIARSFFFVMRAWMHDYVAQNVGVDEVPVIYLYKQGPDYRQIAEAAGEKYDLEAWKVEVQRIGEAIAEHPSEAGPQEGGEG